MNFGGKTLAKKKNIITVTIRNYRYAIALPPGNYTIYFSVDMIKFGLTINFPQNDSTLMYWAQALINIQSDGSVSIESNINLRSIGNIDYLNKDTTFICQPIISKKNMLRDALIKNIDLVLKGLS